LINVHAPRNEKTEGVNEELYNLLEHNINQIGNLEAKWSPGDQIVMTLGDPNISSEH